MKPQLVADENTSHNLVGDVPGVVKSAGWMAALGLVSGIGGLARVNYLGETKAI
jgi:hypothetical protein